jgi:TolB-like protein/class 3 adenylate cyclase/Tfp pilus assembly protein PilF
MPLTRRLTAILAADVAGYSRLMGTDEEGTHERLKAHRRELIDPKIEEHHGRIVKTTGDGLLAEFPSVIEAVLCAVELQSGMRHRNVTVPEHQRISLRVGVNFGDVIAEPDDIFGDGVNIAARLEGLATPDGICISRGVHDEIRDKLPYRFEDLGHRKVKNIGRPLHVFAFQARDAAENPSTGVLEPAAAVLETTPQAPRLSILVLPFTNLNDDREQQYLADAITDDVTTDLSRIAEMIVISRNTAFTYRDRSVNTRQIGNELNVRYVLEGSVRRSGPRIRVNTQLIDAETDAHIWADRFDYSTDDLFALQDEVTSKIAVALNLQLIGAEAARPADDPDALDFILRGRAALYLHETSTPETFATAISLFESALAIDPHSIDAQALLALALVARVFEQMTDTAAADTERTEVLVDQAITASPRHFLARYAKAQVLRAQGHYQAAIPEYEMAIALNRNGVLAIAALGICKFFTGDLEEAIPAQELAIRLSPRDRYLANWYWRIGMVHLLQSRIDEAILWIEKARIANPRFPGPRAWLASAYALKGEGERAAAELYEARRLSRDNRYTSITRHKETHSFGSSKTNALAEATFLAGLRKAGVPEH